MSFGTKPCKFCGKSIKLKIKRDIERKKFCSKTCLGKWTSKQPGREEITKKMIKLASTPEANKKKGRKGKDHPRYIKDRSKVKSKRGRHECTEWRKAVFERDNYTCQFCKTRGGTLNADHIKPYCDYPELRFELTNGRTLCIDCHKKTDTYVIPKYDKRTEE